MQERIIQSLPGGRGESLCYVGVAGFAKAVPLLRADAPYVGTGIERVTACDQFAALVSGGPWWPSRR